ncbi:proline racemase family protein [Aquisalimonas lutea]|uniref:proline racemase family protein n=1 Tax=Aquisalimonas lutea TaxID=1327750 RepID=UPI0025B4D2F6|nr:proline racemase family protein [Aquisalimonas lutea]MDN3517851.1 proline racemase family protein [Aquisalimonas lutea]
MRRDDNLRSLHLVDVDVGGDLHRVVLDGVAPAPGATVREAMDYMEGSADGLRRLLITEPFGYESMCVDLVLPAALPGAQLGFVIMEVMGYPYYSGSNTIATTAAVLEAGLIPMEEGSQTVRLESPAGVNTVIAHNEGGHVRSVTTRGGAAFIQAAEQTVDVPGIGTVVYDLAWSGGYYLLVDAAVLGHEIAEANVAAMTATADRIVRAVQEGFSHRHPELGDVGLPRFLHFMGPLEHQPDGSIRSASATYGHPGVIWHCPTGTGTSARMARMAGQGLLEPGVVFETVSPFGNAFQGVITEHTRVGDYAAIDNTITAQPYPMAYMSLTVDVDAPMLRSYELDHVLTRRAPRLTMDGAGP